MSYKFNPFTKKPDYYETGGSGSTDEVARDNIMILAWNMAISNGLTKFNLEDGVVDEFEDESGIDTDASQNESYNSSDDCYSPSAEVVIDNMEYATDEAAQAAYVTNAEYDSYTKLLLKGSGADESKPTPATTGQTITYVGDAKVDTGVADMFGGNRGVFTFDGTGDYLTIPDSADWDFGAGDFTIEFFLRATSVTGTVYALWDFNSAGNNYSVIFFRVNSTLTLGVKCTDTTVFNTMSGNISINTWHHIAAVRNGATVSLYIDGTSVGTPGNIGTKTVNNLIASTVSIGRAGDYASYFAGQVANIRCSKGIARYTGNFTAPTADYEQVFGSYSESTIKTKGSYSLKGIAAATDSLNKTLTRSLASAIDLTDVSWVQLDFRSDRASANVTFGWQQSISVSASFTPSLTSAGSFERFIWSLDDISNGAKNSISALYITLINADASNTFYVDGWIGPLANMTLISNEDEADTEPTEARFLALMEPVDSITVNTDLKAYVSNDDGSNYDQVTLTDEGYFDSTKKILAGNVTLTDRSDKTMRQKIVTDNNKDLKVHAWGLLWK